MVSVDTANTAVFLTCEHASNDIPADYRHCFRDAGEMLATHRGWDIGAATLTHHLARTLGPRLAAPPLLADASRLLVDLNRSIHHPRIFSPFTADLPQERRKQLLALHYHPYRKTATDGMTAAINRGQCIIHLSVHSFTPSLDGEAPRNADIGLLYDPRRAAETTLALAWQARVRRRAPALRVRRNYPYRGTADGFTTTLRRIFAEADYIGLELEVNQALTDAPSSDWLWQREALAQSLTDALNATVNTQRPVTGSTGH